MRLAPKFLAVLCSTVLLERHARQIENEVGQGFLVCIDSMVIDGALLYEHSLELGRGDVFVEVEQRPCAVIGKIAASGTQQQVQPGQGASDLIIGQ